MNCLPNNETVLPEGCEEMQGLNKSLNFSVAVAVPIINEAKKYDRNLGETAEIIFILVYTVLIGTGISANMLICFVVARKSQMHTPRNLYIVNLTISDLTMCLICMPFTLITILKRKWLLGTVLCKLVPVLQGTNIMISIGTITMIALDRYFTIVRRHDTVSTRSSVIMCIICVWIFSILASSPLAYYQVVEPFRFGNLVLYDTCIEKWPSHSLKITYTVCILLIQAVIPASVVGVVHIRIASYLHTHAKSQTNERRAQRELHRNRRTTYLLLGIAVLFLSSWLPLSLFSLYADIMYPPGRKPEVSTETLYFILAMCHLVAMSSAVSNPIVYGFLNANIRYEFIQLCSSRCAADYMNQNNNVNVDDQTTTKTMLATSTQRRSGPVSTFDSYERPGSYFCRKILPLEENSTTLRELSSGMTNLATDLKNLGLDGVDRSL